MSETPIVFSIKIGRRFFTGLSAALLLLFSAGDIVTEELKLTSYYPSPYGVYEELRATISSYLAYSSGCVGIGGNACSRKLDVVGDFRATGDATVGRMGVGMMAPGRTLDVNGAAFFRQLGVGTAPPASGVSVLGQTLVGGLTVLDGTQGSERVMTSNGGGLGRWDTMFPQSSCSWTAVSNNAGFSCPAGFYIAGVCFSNTPSGCSPAVSGTAAASWSSGGVYCCSG